MTSTGDLSDSDYDYDGADEDGMESLVLPPFIVVKGEKIATIKAWDFYNTYVNSSCVPTGRMAIVLCSGVKDTRVRLRAPGAQVDHLDEEFLYGGVDESTQLTFCNGGIARWMLCIHHMAMRAAPGLPDDPVVWTLMSAGSTKKYPYFRFLLYCGLDDVRSNSRLLSMTKNDEQRLLYLRQKYGYLQHALLEHKVEIFSIPPTREEFEHGSQDMQRTQSMDSDTGSTTGSL